MPIKTDLHIIKGMQRDISVSKANAEFAFDALNIRLTAREGNTLLSVTNEKGNKEVPINTLGEAVNIEGVVIGKEIINNYLVLFTTSIEESPEYRDRIYRLEKDLNGFTCTILFKGDLNFDIEHPIESIGIFENEDIQKVYWTDNKSQPRFINIVTKESIRNKWTNTSFNFVTSLSLKEDIEINKIPNTNGVFSPGVIQYAFSYYNKYGQSSNIIYTSPLYYISHNNRGASPEDITSNSFFIKVKNIDNKFEYLRIYSIHRASIDATPNVKRVIDLSITGLEEIDFVDTGNIGSNTDPTELLYIGGEDILAETITHKDNTLFLGNISLNVPNISDSIKNAFRQHSNFNIPILFKSSEFTINKKVTLENPSGVYPYKVNLQESSLDIKTFKYLEWYRFGVQFQHKTGKWSEPVWIEDKQNNINLKGDFLKKNNVYLTIAHSVFNNSEIIKELIEKGFIKARPVIVYPTIHDRECICQGVLCPTVYNVEDRLNNAPFVQSSWFTRPNAPFDLYKSGGIITLTVTTKDSIQNDEGVYETYGPPKNANIGGDYIINDNIFSYKSKKIEGDIIAEVVLEATEYIDDFEIEKFDTAKSTSDYYSFSIYGYSYETKRDLMDRDNPFEEFSENSRFGITSSETLNLTINPGTPSERKKLIDTANYGTWAEFRHNKPIPKNSLKNAEIQCIAETASPINDFETKEDLYKWTKRYSNLFYIDQSILTLHSPEIEFDDSIRSIEKENLKLRIVGIVPMTGFVGDIDIQTSTPPNTFINSKNLAPGFYKEPIKANNISRFGWRGIGSGAFWLDEISGNYADRNKDELSTGFVVYPWHRNGSLNNGRNINGEQPSALLKHKKISNLRFSYNTFYLSNNEIWNAYTKDDNIHTGISGVSIFDSNEQSLIKIPRPENSNLYDITYYGNIDKVVTPSVYSYIEDDKVKYINEYPIIVTGTNHINNVHTIFIGNYSKLDKYAPDDLKVGTEPVSMKYKSTPHAVLALNYTKDKEQNVLPTIQDGEMSPIATFWDINPVSSTYNGKKAFWSDSEYKVHQDVVDFYLRDIETNKAAGLGLEYGFLWLGELYRDEVINRFGGNTEEALRNNQWLSCGKAVFLTEEGTESPVSSFALEWTEGDTYYQRYDHLKTYPYTLEDQNSIVDIISFMCETRINIDGRYDKNRGLSSNLIITPNNFNKLNKAYSQIDNFFNYKILDNKYSLNNFPNTITWTKEKFLGEDIDTWTNITLASTLELDGDKGEITALKTFNNEIFCFQKQGISNILFNSRVQIPTSDGVPIEITNGLKVQGKRYLSSIGCSNKWSIAESPVGLYFIDSNTDEIYLFNGQITSLSTQLGFSSYAKEHNHLNKWNPITFDNFRTHYDKSNGDVYFTDKTSCLVYSESLGQFTSFMSYEETPYMFNIDNSFYAIKNNKIWEQFAGDYNSFYGETKPYSITVISNPDSFYDKVFNTIEFRADTWSNNTLLNNITFDTLEVWNEYQRGIEYLINDKGKPSPLKKKFRVWRANIPRDIINNRDRIRNTWAYVKLEHSNPSNYKTEFHDLMVHYFI